LGAIYNHLEIRLGKLCAEEKVNYNKGRNTHRVKKVQIDAERACAQGSPHRKKDYQVY
jgi:hypothetical protein